MSVPPLSRGLLPQLAWAALRAQPGRSLSCLLAILIGVALGYAIHLINHSAVSEFSRATSAISGAADLSLRGKLPDALYAGLARDPAVAVASPMLEVMASLPGQRQPLHLLGVDALKAGQVSPRLIGQPEAVVEAGTQPSGLALLEQDAIFLSPAARQWLGVKVGDFITVQIGLQDVRWRVAGHLPAAGAGQRLGVIDIAAAQWRLHRPGELSRIDIKLKAGAEARALQQRWQARLPAGARFETPELAEQRSADMSRAYRVNLTVLGLVALFTGSFLVFSTQILSLLRRRSQLALLRVLGLRRDELVRLVLLEAILLGGLGSALGIAAGLGLASVALQLMGGDLGGGFFNGVSPSLQVEPVAMLGFFGLGLLATLAGSLFPTLEAAKARPARALKAGDEESVLEKARRFWPGVILFGLAALLLQCGPISELPIPGYAAIACVLVGALWLMPWLAGQLLGLIPQSWRQSPVAGLALTQLKEAPGYAGVGLAGILSSFSLMVAMAIMVASFRVSVIDWLDHLLPADLYLRTASNGETAFLSAADQALIRATPGLTRVEFSRLQWISLDAQRPAVALVARSFDVTAADRHLPLVDTITPLPSGATPVWVSEAIVDLYGIRPGQTLALPLAGRQVPVTVAGVWRDYVRQQGSVVLTLKDYQRLTGDLNANDAALWPAPSVSATMLEAALRRQLPRGDRLEFAERGTIRQISLTIFDRSFAVTYLLEAVAVLVGLLGIGVSFGGQALARLREFGMLRHIGYRQRDIDQLLAIEGALLASLGVAAGLVLGWLISQILIRVINPQSFHWSMQTSIPWTMLLTISAVLVGLSALTAVWAGRRALAVGAIRAVKEDW